MATTALAEAKNILLTHQCKLIVGTSSAKTTADASNGEDFVVINNIRLDASHPEQRVDVGLKRIYFHAKPDIELAFTCRGAPKVIKAITDRGVQDANGWITEYKWFFQAKSVTGTVQTSTVTITGQLIDYSAERPSDDQTQPLSCSGRIRVTDDKPTVTSA